MVKIEVVLGSAGAYLMIGGKWVAGSEPTGFDSFVVEKKLFQRAFPDGISAAENLVREKVSDYDAEHGRTDPETGTREFPGNGAKWSQEMKELADEIAALLEKKKKPRSRIESDPAFAEMAGERA